MARLLLGRRARSSSRGQILPLFAIFLTAMLLMMSLVLDASSALLMRREYQSAADAAAMAAANVSGFEANGCDGSLGAATTAAGISVAANLPGYAGSVVVTCPNDPIYKETAVKVSLSGNSPGFFSKVVGINSFAVSTTATAINGQIIGPAYSVVQLDPGPPATSTGCPSTLFHGNLTAIFEGSLYVNSDCTSGPNQALNADGSSGSITFAAGAEASVVGGYVDIHHLFAVPPTTGVSPLPDPLAWLPTPGVPANAPAPTNCTGSTGSDKIYYPGNYPTGIQVSTSDRAFLMPGLYYLSNTPAKGGLQVTSSAQLYSVNSTFLPANCADTAAPAAWKKTTDPTLNTPKWQANCSAPGCGVLFVNAANNSKGDFSVTSSTTFMVLPYQPGVKVYKNMLIWQLGAPHFQPTITLQGGSQSMLTGGIYAPKGLVQMQGGAGGSGGMLTVQFISYDLVLGGNPVFHFVYKSDLLPAPLGYGLVK